MLHLLLRRAVRGLIALLLPSAGSGKLVGGIVAGVGMRSAKSKVRSLGGEPVNAVQALITRCQDCTGRPLSFY